MRIVAVVLVLVAGGVLTSPAAQPWAFEPVEGLPNQTVSALLQDHRGFLWIGTADGLARYDGRQFRVFRRGPRGLPSNTIQALTEGPDGSLWVGTSAGACRLTDEASGRFECPTPRRDVLGIVATAEHIWVVTIAEVWQIDSEGRSFRRFLTSPDSQRRASSARLGSAGDHVWASVDTVGSDSYRRLRYDRAEDRFVTEAASLVPFGHVGLFSPRGNVVSFPARSFENDGEDLAGWETLGHTSMSDQWLGIERGLFRWAGDTIERIPLGDGSPLGRAVLALTVDDAGAIWVGTRSGLFLHDPARARFSHLDPPAEIDAPVMAVTTDTDGMRWVGTLGAGLVRQSDGAEPERVAHPDDAVWALHAVDDALWVGADGGACRRARSGGLVCLRDVLARADGAVYVYDIEDAGDGRLWIGGSVLALVDATTGAIQRRLSLDATETLTVLQRDARGRLWVGAEKRGLWRLDRPEGTLQRVEVEALGAASVWSIEPDGEAMWLGTSEGLFRLHSDASQVEAHAVGLPSSAVYSVVSDGPWLWLSTGQGLARYRPGDGALRVFRTDEGVRNIEFNRRAGHRSPDGRLHFGGLEGVTSFDPSDFDAEPAPPQVVVTRVRVEGASGETFHGGPEVRLGADARVVAFDVSAPIPAGATSIRYAYRLLPLEPGWVDVEGGVVRFAGLPPGKHTFEVRASRGGAVWGAPAFVSVTLDPPWFQTWWARALAALAMACAVGIAVQARIRAVRRQERMRWRIASDLHDDIGSGLASVALLAERVRSHADLEAVEERQLTSVALAARSMIESLREIVWFVDPVHDRPGAFEARVREAAASIVGPRATVDAPPQSRLDAAPLSFRRDVYLILKEALHNASRHAPDAAVRVTLREVHGAVDLTIADDGPGFEVGNMSEGTGLRSLHRRAEAIGGTVVVESSPGEGTTVTLRAPLP